IVRGGIKHGASYAGAIEAGVLADCETLMGWPGAYFYASALWSHGPSLSETHIGDLYAGGATESESTARLYEVWLEQNFFDEKISLRAGQLAVDREFFGTDIGTL